MDLNIAKISLNNENNRDLNIKLHHNYFRFKCQRCASFCCKLGGPPISEKDIKRIEREGYKTDDFLLQPLIDSRFKGRFLEYKAAMKSREDGSCFFLRFNKKMNLYGCLIYDYRPTLCRLYPFELEKVNANSLLLKVIPSCRGLNASDGEQVDEKFITKHLLDIIMEHLEIKGITLRKGYVE